MGTFFKDRNSVADNSSTEAPAKIELSVALLMHKMSDAKDLAKTLRKTGVIPHVYQSLREFWDGVLASPPTLCIIDVKNMSDEERVLKNHPLIKNESLNLAFYYQENSRALLSSTFGLHHFGIIRQSDNYDVQLRPVLERLNKLLKIQGENVLLKKQLARAKSRSLMLLESAQSYKEKEDHQKAILRLLEQLDLEDEGDYFGLVGKVLSAWDEIKEFAMVELNPSRQKLLSPDLKLEKYRQLPTLWLGQTQEQGIEFFASNMAGQVAMDILGTDIVSLKITGHRPLPEVMIFLKVSAELAENFPWNYLERFLCGKFSQHQVGRALTSSKMQEETLNPWELLGILDHEFYRTNGQNYALIDVNLSILLEKIKEKPKNNFAWKSFVSEFASQVKVQFRPFQYQFSLVGVHHVAFLIERAEADHFFKVLKAFVAKFSYWKFFEDATTMMSEVIVPEVKMVPLQGISYLRYIENSYEGLERTLSRITLKGGHVPESVIRGGQQGLGYEV